MKRLYLTRTIPALDVKCSDLSGWAVVMVLLLTASDIDSRAGLDVRMMCWSPSCGKTLRSVYFGRQSGQSRG